MSPHNEARITLLLNVNRNILWSESAGRLKRMETRYIVIVKAIIPIQEMMVPEGKEVSLTRGVPRIGEPVTSRNRQRTRIITEA